MKKRLKTKLIFVLLISAVFAISCEGTKAREESKGEFTVVVLPDTQNYSMAYPGIFTTQTDWLVDKKESLNIVFVTHEGDIVETHNSVTEWENANASMSVLDGVIPYGVLPGNHDQPTGYYNAYFSYTRCESEPWYGGHYGDTNDNNFQLISAGGMDFIIIHLRCDPPESALDWADVVLDSYPDRRAIITTHTIMNVDGTRNSTGEQIFNALKDNGNLFLMLCGHHHGEARRADVVNGNTIYQILANYQGRSNGGDGWLRLMKFAPNEDRIYIETYSPYLDKYETDEDSQFVLVYEMEDYETEPANTSWRDSNSWIAISHILMVFLIGLAILVRIAMARLLGKVR